MPGYHVLASVKVLTAACGAKLVHSSTVTAPLVTHSLNGYVGWTPNAALEDCGREGRFFSVEVSSAAAAPVRRSGSKWLSTMSRPPLAPSLGRVVRLFSTWLALPYEASRYQTSAPGGVVLDLLDLPGALR